MGKSLAKDRPKNRQMVRLRDALLAPPTLDARRAILLKQWMGPSSEALAIPAARLPTGALARTVVN